MYADSEARVAIASTTGVEAEAEQTFCFVYVLAHAGRDGDRQSGLGFSVGREPAELDPRAAGREAAEKARALLGAGPCPTGSYTVVFDRDVVAALLSSIAPALSADAVQKGRSVFAGRLGEGVASPLVTLVDDGLAIDGMATNPFDGEGVPQQVTSLVEGGVLRAYLHNTYTARKEGAQSRFHRQCRSSLVPLAPRGGGHQPHAAGRRGRLGRAAPSGGPRTLRGERRRRALRV